MCVDALNLAKTISFERIPAQTLPSAASMGNLGAAGLTTNETVGSASLALGRRTVPTTARRALVAGCVLAAFSLGSAWAAGVGDPTAPAPAWRASLSSALAATHDGGGSAGELAGRSTPDRADRGLARSPLDTSVTTPTPAAGVDSAATQAFSLGSPLASALTSPDPAAPVAGLDDQARALAAQVKAAEAAKKAAAKAKAAAEAAQAEAARLANVHRWVRPNYGGLSSPFGSRWGRVHEGIDLAGGYSSPILAATSGTVIYAGPESGYGEVLKIADWDGTQTWYGHMSKFLVKAGDKVKPGQKIALVGAAGDATGPHLHFEVRVNGVPIDPIPFLAARGVHI
jgi:murein DD-endopeptidase MepM/ murein hydrolase activator NlpD